MELKEIREKDLRCRNCQHLIVEAVNKDYSRGSGCCFHNDSNDPCYKTMKTRARYFHIAACSNYEPRTSTFEVLQGGTVEEQEELISYYEEKPYRMRHKSSIQKAIKERKNKPE